MNLAIIGGTYNPVHVGHLILAQEVRAEFGVDTVLLVPCSIPAHKASPERESGGASPADRLAMLQAAVAGEPGFIVDDCEIRRGGISYTVDTLRHVSRAYAVSGKPGLVIGDDLVAGFPGWREPEAIAEQADLIVAHRLSAREVAFPYPHRYCHNPVVGISSSSVRDRLRRGLPCRFLVPDVVLSYIEAHGLYR